MELVLFVLRRLCYSHKHRRPLTALERGTNVFVSVSADFATLDFLGANQGIFTRTSHSERPQAVDE
jgi:hypothetical protein